MTNNSNVPVDIGDLVKSQVESEYKKDQERRPEGLPLFFLDYGTTVLRLYFEPISRLLFREIKTHRINNKRFACMGFECPLCKKADGIKKKWDGAWTFQSMSAFVVLAYIYSTSYQNQYVKTEQPVYLLLKPKVKSALIGMLHNRTKDRIGKWLDPSEEVAPVEIILSRKNCSVGFTEEPQKLPPLATNDDGTFKHNSLTKVWFPDNYTPDDETQVEIQKALVFMDKKYQDHLNDNQKDPTEEDDKPQTGTQMADDLSAETQPEEKEEKPDCFGSHPDNVDQTCVMCDYENECTPATASKKEASA